MPGRSTGILSWLCWLARMSWCVPLLPTLLPTSLKSSFRSTGVVPSCRSPQKLDRRFHAAS